MPWLWLNDTNFSPFGENWTRAGQLRFLYWMHLKQQIKFLIVKTIFLNPISWKFQFINIYFIEISLNSLFFQKRIMTYRQYETFPENDIFEKSWLFMLNCLLPRLPSTNCMMLPWVSRYGLTSSSSCKPKSRFSSSVKIKIVNLLFETFKNKAYNKIMEMEKNDAILINWISLFLF